MGSYQNDGFLADADPCLNLNYLMTVLLGLKIVTYLFLMLVVTWLVTSKHGESEKIKQLLNCLSVRNV